VLPSDPFPADPPLTRSAPAIPQGPLRAIVGNQLLADPVMRVYFGQRGENFDGCVTGEGFTAYEKVGFRTAFDQISAVARVDFVVVNTPEAATIAHELLHAMGLMHPHDSGDRSQTMPSVVAPFDIYGWAGLNQGSRRRCWICTLRH
jgi:hypothetical protein